MATFNFKCPQCGNLLSGNEEWCGKRVQCPYCQQVVMVPTMNNPNPQSYNPNPQSYNPNPQMYQNPGYNNYAGNSYRNAASKSTTSLVLGIVSLIAWFIPLIGFPVSITGLVFGIRNKHTAGIVLNVIGLVLTLINSVVGAVLGAQGELF